MVFYYRTTDGHLVYKGKDKYENEQLIKFAFPQDVWFHVDDFSSAHVYIRLHEGETWDNIDPKNLAQICQLTKENSIDGSKKAKVDIIFTPARNLNKTLDMEVGAVGYKNDKLVKKVRNVERDKAILKPIEKTEQWIEKDLEKELADYENEQNRQKHKEYKESERQRRLEEEARREEAAKMDYKLMEVKELMRSNKEQNDDDDFM